MPAEARRVLVDTSAFVALANRDDAFRPVAGAIVNRLRQEALVPFTTSFVVAETHALLLARGSATLARNWLRGVPVGEVWVTEDDYAAGKQIIQAHRDKSYSLTDAISFAIMARVGTRLAFSFDEHFDQYGLERVRP